MRSKSRAEEYDRREEEELEYLKENTAKQNAKIGSTIFWLVLIGVIASLIALTNNAR